MTMFLDVLKTLPRTNCGECGQATCMAFATQVIKEGEDLGKCP
ncbi:MAG: (Fe-S)-binding protein [Syntrophales bacterium]|nr:(Fe-S)-binding protein [Syntrophales bacterium]MDD5642811.1 (Fe-S)-binding protein [Syntrophales bacterium]